MEIIHYKEHKKDWKSNQSPGKSRDTIKQIQIFIVGDLERKEETMLVNFPDLIKDTNKNIKEIQQISNIINSKRNTPRHFSQPLETERKKKRVLQSAREKLLITYKKSSKYYEQISH